MQKNPGISEEAIEIPQEVLNFPQKHLRGGTTFRFWSSGKCEIG